MRVNGSSWFRSASALAALATACASGTSWAAGPAPARIACDDTLKEAFRPDPLTTVAAVKAFRKGDLLVISEPVTAMTPKAANDLCMVKLNVGPGNPGPADAPSTSPGIGIEVWLPSPANWDGRLHSIGGRGGFDGGTQGSPEAVGWVSAALNAGNDNAVSASTDSGHAQSDGSWAMNPDGTPNRQGWIDFAQRAQHEMAVKTKALIRAYYGRPPRFSYYEGSSTGGRHGYRLAQEHPDDYDGIIGNLSAMNWAEWTTNGVYRSLVVERDLGGVPLTEGQQDLVSNAAIHTCDVVGGQHLGYILDNEACRYDPTHDLGVLCPSEGGRDTTPDCVTQRQANAVNKFWYGITADGSVPSPALDNGAHTTLTGPHRWYGLTRGTSLYNWYYSRGPGAKIMAAMGFKGAVGVTVVGSGDARRIDAIGYVADQVALELQNPTIADPTFHNASGNGEGGWRDLSYAQFGNAFDRGVALDPVFGRIASDDPDLSAFKARGGKMLSWHGWNDEAIPVLGTIRYYDRVIQKMGGVAQAQSVLKLYIVPGAGHLSPQGTSNPDANPPAVAPGQFYRLLIDWVEKGIEPGRIELQSPSATPVRITQPICPYPQKATYQGGDPRVTTSYVCS